MEIATDCGSYNITKNLCEALGINPNEVCKLTIEIESGQFFTVKIKKFLLKDTYKTFVDEIQKYDIKEIK